MAGARLGYRARWLAQGLGIPPDSGAMLVFMPDGGMVLAKGLKAESERVMEHHLRREELEGLFKQELRA